MSLAACLGSDLARSLVVCIGMDCATAAIVARVMTDRHGKTIDLQSLGDQPPGAIQRVTEDFVARGWLSHRGTGWLVGPDHSPLGLDAFLQGAAAMQASVPDDGTATAVVTMPPAPSAIATVLPSMGLSHASLVPTKAAFERVADVAVNSFTIMTPFVNDDGLAIAIALFRRTRASRRCLVVRLSDTARVAIARARKELTDAGVEVLDYTVHAQNGYETFHAKILLADQDLAYVGSANMTVFARHSMELGILADGRAARVVAGVVKSVECIATQLQTASVGGGS